MAFYFANNPLMPSPLPFQAAPSGSGPGAGGGVPSPAGAPGLPGGPEALQPRATGSEGGLAPRHSLPAAGRASAHSASSAGRAAPPGEQVIDIYWPGAPQAGAGAGPAVDTSGLLNCRVALPLISLLSGAVAGASLLGSITAPSGSEDRRGLGVTALWCAAVSAGTLVVWLAVRRRQGERAAGPAEAAQANHVSDESEAPQPLALRRPRLYGLPLGVAIARWGAPFGTLGPVATSFDWNAPRLFVDGSGADRTRDVSHMLTRALVEYQGQDERFRAGLGLFLHHLATDQGLRTDLADLSVDANGRCGDRIGIRLGELLLAQSLREVRDPAVAPRDVVLTLVLHAATQAMKKQMAQRLGVGVIPSADLLLAGFHVMQSTIQQHGIAVPTLFPADDGRDENDLMEQRRTLAPDALAIVQVYGLDLAATAGTSEAEAASAGAGLALLLRDHGGKACEEILTGRLDHLRQPVLADWHQKLAAGADGEGYGPALDQAYGRALAGALRDDLADWMPQAAVPGHADAEEPVASPPKDVRHG